MSDRDKVQQVLDKAQADYNNALAEALDKIQQLETFIANELGIEAKEGMAPASNCASPMSYCSDCGCGKKQRIEGLKK